jgi:REP element-mobilizing transposase RayT
MRQASLFPGKYPIHHGATLARGRRKSLRPLSTKRPIHIVLKSKREIYSRRAIIEAELHRMCTRFGIRLYDVATASDHVHFVARIPSRKLYVAFIRSLTGLLARRFGKNLWALLPFSRVAHWGRAFMKLKKYLAQNREEAAGTRPYSSRTDWYERFRVPI